MIAQIMIALFGVAAIWLSQDSRVEYRKYSSICGLISQPFWFYSTFMAEQWGIFALCFVYTAAWVKGFKLHWITA